MLFAYLGPDTMLPLYSIVGAVIGVVLMFWRKLLMIGRDLVRRVKALAQKPRL